MAMGRGRGSAPPWGADGLLPGEAEDRRFRVLGRLGDGGSASVLACEDLRGGREVAVKLAKPGAREGSLVAREAKVLRAMDTTGCTPKVVHVDRARGQQYIAMERCGQNLAEHLQAASSAGGGGLGEAAALDFGAHMLYCLAAVHWKGYIHRDVKPANFVLRMAPPGGNTPGSGSPGEARWDVLLIDFGLAKKYVTNQWDVLPERPQAEFRGSKTYAPIAAHLKRDLSRRDDLWGLLFSLVELLHGRLPWREAGGRGDSMTWEQVRVLKERCMENLDLLTTPHPLPSPLRGMAEHLQSLTFAQEPNYELLMQLLSRGRCPDLNERPPPVLSAAFDSSLYGTGGKKPAAAVAAAQKRRLSAGVSVEGPNKRLAAATGDLEERRLSSGENLTGTPSHDPGRAPDSTQFNPELPAETGGSRRELCVTARENLCAVSLRDSYDVITDVMQRQVQSQGREATKHWLHDLGAFTAFLAQPAAPPDPAAPDPQRRPPDPRRPRY